MKEKVLFVDRDGVINRLVGYDYGWDSPQTPEDVKLVDGIAQVISWANENKIIVVEVSNQPGVAKGKMSQETSNKIEDRVHQLLKDNGATVDHFYICPHHPKGIVPELSIECDCRKPKAGLLLQAAENLGIDLFNSVVLGDKASDVLAGEAVGCKIILYYHEDDEPDKVAETKTIKTDYKVEKMEKVIPILEQLFKVSNSRSRC